MRDIKELNEFTQKYFNNVLKKDVLDLSKGEKDFLRARREYLTKDYKDKFSSILTEPKEEPKKTIKK
jgi:hypothetical protein